MCARERCLLSHSGMQNWPILRSATESVTETNGPHPAMRPIELCELICCEENRFVANGYRTGAQLGLGAIQVSLIAICGRVRVLGCRTRTVVTGLRRVPDNQAIIDVAGIHRAACNAGADGVIKNPSRHNVPGSAGLIPLQAEERPAVPCIYVLTLHSDASTKRERSRHKAGKFIRIGELILLDSVLVIPDGELS